MNRHIFYFGFFSALSAYLLAFWPVVIELSNTWKTNEDYSHGFFIFPICCYLIWNKCSLNDFSTDKFNWIGLCAVIVGLGLYLIGLFSYFKTLAYLSFIIVGWTSLFFLFGYRFIKKFSWELFLLVFMLPIPARIYASITLPLQLGVTKVSFVALQLLGIAAYRDGNIIYLTNATLEVVNACSGLRSIITILALSFVVAGIYFENNKNRLLLVCFAIPLAMLSNFTRVIIIAVFAQNGNVSFIESTNHLLLGLCLFAMTLLLLNLVSKAILCIFREK